MPDGATTRRTDRKVAVATAKNPVMVKGRREFFTYRDLGVTEGSNGHMRAQITAAKAGMSRPTGWHYHECESQLVYVLKGWIELEFASGPVRLEAGDSVYIPGGMPHNECRTADEFEILEVSVPAQMGTKPCEAPAGAA
ncbi:MAG TPA: cupin domain-containing protein [Acetobacteraceae bacterium]|nr:cupin domain-containing protein [Acetobacteraceae bacterium]